MKQLSAYPNGYNSLRHSFDKYGFEHVEGSSYNSKQPMSRTTATYAILCVGIENPWLWQCIEDVRLTDIGKYHNLTKTVKSFLNKILNQQSDRISNDLIACALRQTAMR